MAARSESKGVVPPRERLAQSSMRSAPALAAMRAEGALKQAISRYFIFGVGVVVVVAGVAVGGVVGEVVVVVVVIGCVG